jgi:putative ABC transport system ATP-binding protein
MQLLVGLHEAGQTIIVVTHEDDIARYAHRIVRVLDGSIVEDRRQTPVIPPPPPPPQDEKRETDGTTDTAEPHEQ